MNSRLKILRVEILKMKQSEFAKILDITQGALSGIENNNRGIPLNAIQKLAEYSIKDIRVDIMWILTGTSSQHFTTRENNLITLFRKLDKHGKNAIENIAKFEANDNKML